MQTQVTVQIGTQVSASVPETIYNTATTTVIEQVGFWEGIIQWLMALI